jgi:hypothetical protein
MKFGCSTYQVHFSLGTDSPFRSALRLLSDKDFVFTKVDREEFRSMLLNRTESDSLFTPYVKELMHGSTFMICPKEDEKDPACLIFSLKGITAALKAVCPKR